MRVRVRVQGPEQAPVRAVMAADVEQQQVVEQPRLVDVVMEAVEPLPPHPQRRRRNRRWICV